MTAGVAAALAAGMRPPQGLLWTVGGAAAALPLGVGAAKAALGECCLECRFGDSTTGICCLRWYDRDCIMGARAPRHPLHEQLHALRIGILSGLPVYTDCTMESPVHVMVKTCEMT